MKRDRRDVDGAIFRDVVGRGDDRLGKRDGVPDIGRRVIADLYAIRTAGVLHRNEMAPRHRLNCSGRFLDAFVPQSAQMDLAIGWRVVAEDFRPIDVPVSEESVGIAPDGEEKRAAIRARELAEVFEILRGRCALLELDKWLAGEDERRAAIRLFYRAGIFDGGFVRKRSEIVGRHVSTIHKIVERDSVGATAVAI